MADPLDAMFTAAREGQNEPARDPLDTAWGADSASRAGLNIVALRGNNPDQAGRANVLSRQSGLPADTVERNLGVVEARQQQATARTMMQRYPAIGHWSADPRNAAVGRDDMPALGRVAKTVQGFLGSAARAIPAGVLDFTSGIYGIGRIASANAEAYSPIAAGERALFGGSIEGVLATFFRSQQQSGKALADSTAGAPVSNRYANDFISGIRSVPATVGSLAVSAAGAPQLGAGLLAGSVSGSEYAKARDKGQTPLRATIYGAAQGTVEFLTERVPALKYFNDTKAGTTFGRKLLNNLMTEMPQEQAATVFQDLNEWAMLNPEKPFADYLAARPSAALSTAIATAAGASISVGTHEAVSVAVQRIARANDQTRVAERAQADADMLQRTADAASESKTAKRDPDAFARFLELQTGGTASENVYIPGDVLSEYFQSNDMDWHDRGDDAWSFSDDLGAQIDESLATGGDVVLRTSDFAAHVANTPAWDALKDYVRLSPGGMSASEAKDFDAAKDDALAKLEADFAADLERDKAANEPRQKLYQSVRDKLTGAGFTQSAADTNATLVTQRYATRAARMGVGLKGDEFDSVDVQQVLPEGLAPFAAADQMDLVIEALKKQVSPRSGAQKFGPSLVEWIAKQGGIEDRGGDVASMGGADWHRGKPGKRRLIKPHDDTASFLPGEKNANTPDDLAMRAQEAGFLPIGDRPTTADLFESLGRELGGQPIYAEDRTGAGDALREGAAALEAMLEQRGLDPATASKADIKAAVAAYQQEQAGGLDQSFSEGPRGRITFPGDGYGTGQTVIQLFQARDLSTFLHETGHLWLEELRADATGENAPDDLKADWQTAQDWFVANGHDLTDGIPVDAHEMWARGVERHLMEGKSPSIGLRRVFDVFRGWLLSVYQVVGNLRSPITPEIRSVMDRLIATDEEIADATAQQNIKALFTDAAQAGMTEQEFAAYQASTADARNEAFDALLFRTMETIRRQRTKAWRDERETVEAEVRAEVDARPVFRALAALKVKGTKLDRTWLAETYGADALSLLPKAVPPIYAENGTNADALAELNGFRTGDEMVRALMGVEERKRALKASDDKRSARQSIIDERTDEVMQERHGDPLSDGSIQEEALAAIHSDQQGEVIASEIRALSRKTGDQPTPYRLAREWAARTIAESKVVDSLSGSAIQRYARAASKAAKAAEAAILKGDVDETFRQKQAQMLNNALIAEAKKAKDAVDLAVSRLGKLARKATIKSIDQDYLDQVHGLLEQVSFRNETQRSLDRQESFEEWANARQAEGYDVVVPPSFAARLGQRNWSRLSVEELLGLDDTVKQIVHLGRLKQTLLDNQEKREYEAVIGEAMDAIGNLPPRAPSNLMEPSRWGGIKTRVLSIDASLLKMETVFDWLDGNNPNGVFNRVVFRRLGEAQTNEKAMLNDYVGRLTRLLANIPKEQLARWSERIALPELLNRETGEPWVMTRDQLVSMALNMGNEGNAAKLAGGYGWNEAIVLAVLNRELSAADWRYVQGVWDTIEGLWPQIAALEKRLNGVEPEKVERRPIETSAGTLAGGYFPVVYDPNKSIDADVQAAKNSDRLFENSYTKATTPKGFTKARTKVERPIHLTLGVINRHVGEVIHDLTHREAIMDADRFLGDRRIMEGIDQTLGREVRKQMRPWLQHIANEWAQDRRGLSGWDAFAKKLRTNSTIVGMGFRLSTIIAQVAGYSNSAGIIGAKWMGVGFQNAIRNPNEAWRFVTERSGEVRNRMDTLERDIKDNVRRTLGRTDLLAQTQRFAFYGIGMMDRVVVVPTWLGAYEKATAEGMSDADASYAADKAVRLSQGAGAAKDLAAIQRGPEWQRLTTMFYSYFSALYQQQRRLGRDVRMARTQDLPHLAARAFFLILVPPLLSEVLAGRGPGDDDDEAMWAMQKILLSLFGPIPIARDVANAVGSGFGYSFTPAARAFDTGLAVVKDARHIAEGEETTRATRNALETAGYVFGLPTGQIATAVQFAVDVGEGEQDPETVADWYNGLTKGKTDPK